MAYCGRCSRKIEETETLVMVEKLFGLYGASQEPGPHTQQNGAHVRARIGTERKQHEASICMTCADKDPELVPYVKIMLADLGGDRQTGRRITERI